jgi:hypothetical protein
MLGAAYTNNHYSCSLNDLDGDNRFWDGKPFFIKKGGNQ